jgi:hypothetical protein
MLGIVRKRNILPHDALVACGLSEEVERRCDRIENARATGRYSTCPVDSLIPTVDIYLRKNEHLVPPHDSGAGEHNNRDDGGKIG